MQAPEIAQEALLAVHRRWNELDEPDGYLRRSIVNLSRSAVRRVILERRHAWRFQRTDGLGHEPLIDEMWAEIGRLHRDQRAVIVLRYYEDLSIAEIARLLGKPTGTIKSLLHRAVTTLKETIHDRQ